MKLQLIEPKILFPSSYSTDVSHSSEQSFLSFENGSTTERLFDWIVSCFIHIRLKLFSQRMLNECRSLFTVAFVGDLE